MQIIKYIRKYKILLYLEHMSAVCMVVLAPKIQINAKHNKIIYAFIEV